jgi:hypothetical protein
MTGRRPIDILESGRMPSPWPIVSLVKPRVVKQSFEVASEVAGFLAGSVTAMMPLRSNPHLRVSIRKESASSRNEFPCMQCRLFRIRFVFGVALIALFAAITHADAGAADAPLTVLRRMSFDVSYNVRSRVDTKESGFNGPLSGTSTGNGPNSESRGTISVEVVAATADGGLVVDVAEDTVRNSAPIRVGITDKALFYDRNAGVTEEERMLLHYLARDFVKAGELTAATTWVEETNDTGGSGRTTYRVTAVDESAKTVSLDISGTSSATGVGAFDAKTTGSMTYDTGTLVPLMLALTTRTTLESGSGHTTIDAQMTSTLRDDSFHKK